MALSYTNGLLGIVDPTGPQMDIAPSSSPTGTSGNNLQMKLVDVTIGSTSDYSSGFSISASSLGFGAILAAFGTLRTSGGIPRQNFGQWDPVLSTFRLFEENSGTNGGGFDEIEGADLAASDVLRLAVIGF